MLAQFSETLTNTYNDIISGINILANSLRDEENERMPRITNSLNGLVNEIKIIKSKSEFIMSEIVFIEERFKKFQNSIQDAFSDISAKADEVLILIFLVLSGFFFNLTSILFAEFKTCYTAC